MRVSTKIRFNFYIEPSIRKEFKKICVEKERTMSEVLNELIYGWIRENKSQKK